MCTGVKNVTIYAAPVPFILPSTMTKCGTQDTSKQGTAGQDRKGNECLSVCDSTWITYSTINHPGSTYAWVITGSAIVIPSVTNSIQVYWTGVGAGTVRVTETSAQGCIGINELCVVIVAKPNASFTTMPVASGGIVNACLNQTILFNNTSTTGGGSPFWNYTWVWGDGTSTSLNGLTNGNATHSYSIANTYQVMLIVENECHCKDTAFVTVIVDAKPGPDIECVSTVCPGATVTYKTNAICPNYLWTAINGTIVGSNTNQTVTVTWGAVGPAYLTLQTLGCGATCASPTTVEIPIIVPNALIKGPNLVCFGDCKKFKISCTIPVDSIKWNLPPGLTFNSDSINVNEIEVCFNNPSFTSGLITVNYFHTTPGAVPKLACGGVSNILVNQRPKLNLNYVSEICDLSTLTGGYNTSPSGNIQWTITPAGGILPIFNSIQSANAPFNPLWVWGPGTFTITATDLSGNYCNSPQSFVLKVNPIPPAPDSITGPILVCPNTPYQYLGFATASNYTLNWTVSGGTPINASGPFISILWGPGPSYGISLVQVDPKTGCQSAAINYVVNSQLPLSPSIITGPVTACGNSTVTNAYTTSSPGTLFEWSISPAAAGSISSGNYTPTISVQWNNYSGPAMVTLTRTVCGTSIVTNYPVTLTAPPAPNISVPSAICQGVNALMSSSTPGATFAWNFGDGGTGTGSPVNHIYNSPGVYIVTLTATYTGSCTGSASVTAGIIVRPRPTVNISTPDPNVFCGTIGNVNMAVASPAILTTYQWFRAPSTFLASGSTYTSNVLGSYYVVATNNFGCTASSNFITIDTNCGNCVPDPSYNVSLNIIKQGCNKDSFVGTFTPGASSPQFNFDDIYGSPNIVSGTNATHTFPEPGYYRVKFCVKVPNITNTDSCVICDTKVDTIKYIPNFFASLACLQGNDSVRVNLGNTTKILTGYPTPSYAWSYNGNPTFSTSANSFIHLLPGTYTFTLVVNGNCIKNLVVTIPTLPQAIFTSTDSVCVNAPLAFTNASTGIYNNITWTFGDGASSLLTNPIKTYAVANQYTVTLSITNAFGCTDTMVKLVTVLPNSLSTAVLPMGPTSFCEGGNVQLNSNITGGYPVYNLIWSTTQVIPNINAIYTGQYYFDVMDSKGCFMRSNTVNVMVKPTPKPNITGPIKVCFGQNPTFSVNYPSSPYAIEWSLDGAMTPWFNQSNYLVFGPSIGNHVLIVRVTSPDTCIGYDTFRFRVYPLPNVSVGPGANLCEGQTHLIVGSSTSPIIIANYWNTGSNNDSIYASTPGNYIFTVVDTNGCKNDAFKVIHPLPNFCGLMTGCYDICDTTKNLVWFGPKGYASYQWYYNNTPIPWAVSDTFHIPLYQSGSYTLLLTTIHGCSKMSPSINIKFIKCDSCIIDLHADVICGPIDQAGNQTYSVTMQVNNGLAAGAGINISSPQGSVTGVSPATVPLGWSNVTFTFTDIPAIDTSVCFTVTLFTATRKCSKTICVPLPPCEKECVKTIKWKSFVCAGTNGAGNPIYSMCVDVFWGGSNGSTLTVNTPSGSFVTNPVTINNGNQTICYTYTDLPPYTGFSTFYFTFFDAATKTVCRDSLKRDYKPCGDTCKVEIFGMCAHCKRLNATNSTYDIDLVINNTLGTNANVSVLPIPGGVFGAPSPAVIPPGINNVSIPFTDNNPRDSIICFRVLLSTPTISCWQDICVYLPVCDSNDHVNIHNQTPLSFFTVAPNPANQSVTIQYVQQTDASNVIEVRNIEGRIVHQQFLNNSTNQTQLDIMYWPQGTYYISLRSDEIYRGTIQLSVQH
ncbi:MAG: PKD domain-containing protein [Bacteroidetes bacterium]|nr:PKD domain-containing protein [Bacteroidota bacterium]